MAELDLHDPDRGLPGGDHAYIRYNKATRRGLADEPAVQVRVSLDHMLGSRGDGFLVAQVGSRA